jgi:trk system potassium uptake protein TrkH
MKIEKGTKIAQTTKYTMISFFLLIVIGGILLNLPISNMPGKPHDLLNSLFTSAASVCVAGLSTVTAGEQYTFFGQLVMLILIQIGALGFIFIISSIFLITKKKLSFKNQINISEILGTPERLSEVKTLIRRIIKFTFTIELIGALILLIRFVPMFGPAMGIWQSIFTSVSSFCNCGFDLLGSNSLIDFAEDYLVLRSLRSANRVRKSWIYSLE